MTFVNYKDLVAIAEENGFTVTSTNTGAHNRGSKHYLGLAIDVRTRDKTDLQCDEFIKMLRGLGLTVFDERRKPAGQKVWSGPHLHIEISSAKTIHPSTVKFGDKGAVVKDVQNKLVKVGLLRLDQVDGWFGNDTLFAVKAFQMKNGLTIDGVVGTGTQAALKAAI